MIKKFMFLITAGVIFGLCQPAFAAAVSGTHPVIDGSLISLATEYDYVFDRDLKSSDLTAGVLDEQNTFYAKITLRAADFLYIYGKVGGVNFVTEYSMNNGSTFKEEYDTGLYTGGGIKLIHEFVPRVKFGASAQLNWWRSDIDSVAYTDTSGRVIDTISGRASAWEFQCSGMLSYLIDFQSLIHPVHGEFPEMMPYVGLKYAHLKMDSDVIATSSGQEVALPDDIKNDNKLGLILGVDITFPSLTGFSFNVEGRFIDDTAISGYLNYSF